MPASKIAVIETRLPYTDRRALSEAWFSALHLAPGDAGVVPAASPKAGPQGAQNVATVRVARARGASVASRREPVRTIAYAARRSAYAGLDAPARRATDVRQTPALTRTFERERSYPPFRTSLTLEGASGTRVHLIVRRVGPTLHVVALCPPAVEALVRRALASADLHFRARGEQLHVDVKEARAQA